MIYVILIIMAAIICLIDVILRIRSKKLLKSKKKNKVKKILEKISFKLRLRKSEHYLKTERILKDVSLNMTVELFYLYKVIFAIMSAAAIIIVNNINKINILIKIEKLGLDKFEFTADIKIILIIFLLSAILPEFLLSQFVKIKSIFAQKEVLVLQTYTIMLIKTGKNVKDIINSLYNRSKIFKNNFEFALNTYSTDPNYSLEFLKNSSQISGFTKIIVALEQCLNSDREVSLKFLANSRKITKELNRLEKIKKDGKKRILNTLMLILPLSACVAISAYPWFLYVIRLINEIPV